MGRSANGYKLPSATLLRPAEDAAGIDEDELKERAARLHMELIEAIAETCWQSGRRSCRLRW